MGASMTREVELPTTPFSKALRGFSSFNLSGVGDIMGASVQKTDVTCLHSCHRCGVLWQKKTRKQRKMYSFKPNYMFSSLSLCQLGSIFLALPSKEP